MFGRMTADGYPATKKLKCARVTAGRVGAERRLRRYASADLRPVHETRCVRLAKALSKCRAGIASRAGRGKGGSPRPTGTPSPSGGGLGWGPAVVASATRHAAVRPRSTISRHWLQVNAENPSDLPRRHDRGAPCATTPSRWRAAEFQRHVGTMSRTGRTAGPLPGPPPEGEGVQRGGACWICAPQTDARAQGKGCSPRPTGTPSPSGGGLGWGPAVVASATRHAAVQPRSTISWH